MSLSSIAQDSALRLSRRSLTADELVEVAVESAAGAASGPNPRPAVESARDAVKRAQSADSPSTPMVSGPISQLVKYIPTETVALYVAITAALGEVTVAAGRDVADEDFSGRWVAVLVMAVVTYAFAVGLSYRAQKDAGITRFHVPIFEPLAASAAFLVWSLSLPGTPLRDFTWYDGAWSTVLILGGTVLIAGVGHVLGMDVTWKKVLPDTPSSPHTP